MTTYIEPILLLSDARGIYIPRDTIDILENDKWKGFDKKLLTDLSDVNNENYWDSWDTILNNAYYVDDDATYHLYQDGDLWALSFDNLSDETKKNFGLDD